GPGARSRFCRGVEAFYTEPGVSLGVARLYDESTGTGSRRGSTHREIDALKRRTPLCRLQPLALALLLASAVVQAQTAAVPLYDNLGNHQYLITTSDPQAQRYFDEGLRLYYAFNHQE